MVNAAERGEVTGGIEHAMPEWFKDSFLEIADDVSEAADENKHVILFFQLNECPYCFRMLEECFKEESMKKRIQQDFDVISINILGDREIVFNPSLSMSEKQLSNELKVMATPSIVFLNKDNERVVRVDGYRSPERFKHILDYVSSQSYEQTGLADYLESNLKPDVYQLKDHGQFEQITDFSSIQGPLAVIFEDASCTDCPEFHENLLSREDVKQELARFTVVRIDAASQQSIVDVNGKMTTAKAWTRSLKMRYRPGVILFDQGEEISRIESLLYSFHFKETLRYVGTGIHRDLDYREYSDRRREELLSKGMDIQLSD